MSPSSRSIRICCLVSLIGIAATLSGCGYKVVKEAPPALLRTPQASYLALEATKEVTAAQLILDCTATTIQAQSLIQWAK